MTFRTKEEHDRLVAEGKHRLLTQHPNCINDWMYDKSISDAEFWSRVYGQEGFGEDDEPDYSDYEDWERQKIEEWGLMPPVPCPECSQTEACGYDDQGRPWIHLVKDHDEE